MKMRTFRTLLSSIISRYVVRMKIFNRQNIGSVHDRLESIVLIFSAYSFDSISNYLHEFWIFKYKHFRSEIASQRILEQKPLLSLAPISFWSNESIIHFYSVSMNHGKVEIRSEINSKMMIWCVERWWMFIIVCWINLFLYMNILNVGPDRRKSVQLK